jgi:hypothetical protein
MIYFFYILKFHTISTQSQVKRLPYHVNKRTWNFTTQFDISNWTCDVSLSSFKYNSGLTEFGIWWCILEWNLVTLWLKMYVHGTECKWLEWLFDAPLAHICVCVNVEMDCLCIGIEFVMTSWNLKWDFSSRSSSYFNPSLS